MMRFYDEAIRVFADLALFNLNFTWIADDESVRQDPCMTVSDRRSQSTITF